MIPDDEVSSSTTSGSSEISLVSFVGFQEHLVMNFLKTFVNNNVKEILLFSSMVQKTATEQYIINLELRKKAIRFIRDILGNKVHISLTEMENIWDFQDYYVRLSQNLVEKAIVNISAGPAVFAAAGIIWAMENNHYISYSVEYHNNGKLISSVFNLLDLRPYINSVFSTDNVDKMIVNAMREGKFDTLQIYKQINEVLKYRISLRSIEIHLRKLNQLGIIDITKGRVNKVSFSQNWSKIGYLLKNSRIRRHES